MPAVEIDASLPSDVLLLTSCSPFGTPTNVSFNLKNRQIEVPTDQDHHTREFLVPDIESGCCTHGRDFDLDSGGALEIYYRGQQSTGSWSATDRSNPLVFKNAAGQPINLPDGLVWVDVVGN
jgi:hypothetical protein